MKIFKKSAAFLIVLSIVAAFFAFGTAAASPASYRGCDYSAVYDYSYYKNTYPDLQAAFKNNASQYIAHFVNCGMYEGRQASEGFSVSYYRNNYADLNAAFGNDLPSYYMHYIKCGSYEGRIAAPTYIFEGCDYSSVYDYSYYRTNYPDLQAAFGNNPRAYISHFVNCGAYEGRQAIETFNVRLYKERNPDLQAAFGDNTTSYYWHYMSYGVYEGRFAGFYSLYNGVSYSDVYNYEYYVQNNPDVAAAFGNNPRAVLAHFVNYGIYEGRRASFGFDVNAYRENNADLQAAFGDDTSAYFLHYMTFGVYEDRPAVNTQIGIDVSKHNGTVDWESVKDAGIQFAIIRIGFGDDMESQDDSQAVRNMDECERLGIPYGVYIYSYALTTEGETESAVSEANHVKRMIADRNPQLGVWYDIEDKCQDSLSKQELTDIAVAFLEEMRPTGLNLGVYANLYFWNNRLDSERLNGYGRWVAQWSDECTYEGTYQLWQYTDKGNVSGIDGNVDMDIWYK